jgi:SpoVK/Ycf46/Vps4 family AAA+-type ATPase
MDSLLENRSSLNVRASRTEIINEFMSEWDGLLSLDCGQSSVMVMGATNRPFVLDDAVLRRLPRRLLVDLPDQQARLAILRVISREDVLEDAKHLIKLSEATPLYSGSDLKNLAKSAATCATRELLSLEKRTGQRLSMESRVIKWVHWEQAMREVPASLSKESDMMKRLRTWNDIYGDRTQVEMNSTASPCSIIGFQ